MVAGLSCCEITDQYFDLARARRELARYQRSGPTGSARMLLKLLERRPLHGCTLLDIGAGIGVLHHELLERGARSAIHVEAASAYVELARTESARRGHGERMQFFLGDFVQLAAELQSADVVTVDRVICCHPDFASLVRAAAGKTRRYLAASFPHDRWYVRAFTAWVNFRRQRAGVKFRTFVHPLGEIHRLLREAGLQCADSSKDMVWEVVVYERPPTGAPAQVRIASDEVLAFTDRSQPAKQEHPESVTDREPNAQRGGACELSPHRQPEPSTLDTLGP